MAQIHPFDWSGRKIAHSTHHFTNLIFISNHRITEWVRLEETTTIPLVHPPCSSRVILGHICVPDCVLGVL